jgi:hypothetical protein
VPRLAKTSEASEMKPSSRALSATLVATLASTWPSVTLAAELGCPGTSVASDADFRSRFPDLLASVQSDFSGRVDLDACARVDLALDGDALIRVSVTLPDGRATSRTVSRAEDVIPSLEALLLVPERTAPLPQPPSPVAPPLPPRKERPSPSDHPDSSFAPEARTLGFELSVISGARVGDGQFGLGLGVMSFLEVRRWLLGFEGRVDAYRPLLGGDPETVLELGILAGRRFDLGDVALDVTAGPAVAMKGLAASQTEVVQMSMGPVERAPIVEEDPSMGPAPRLLLGARLAFRPRAIFRPFLGIDGEVGPARVAREAGSTTSRLPAYVVGFAFGASVGTP